MSDPIVPVRFESLRGSESYVIGTPLSIVKERSMSFLTPADAIWDDGFSMLEDYDRLRID